MADKGNYVSSVRQIGLLVGGRSCEQGGMEQGVPLNYTKNPNVHI